MTNKPEIKGCINRAIANAEIISTDLMNGEDGRAISAKGYLDLALQIEADLKAFRDALPQCLSYDRKFYAETESLMSKDVTAKLAAEAISDD